MTETEQLDTLFPRPKTIVFLSVKGADGKPVEIDIQPIRVGKLAAFFGAVKGLLPAFNDPDNIAITALVMEHTDDVIAALAVALNVDREFVHELDLADMVTAVTAVVEVNADFFIHRLLPALEAAKAKIARLHGPSSASA